MAETMELHEFLGRDIDVIEDVRRRLEDSYTEDYFNPLNGDWISDDYLRIINLTTKPHRLTDKEAGQLDRSITRLNDKQGYLYHRLGASSLLGAYNEAVEQVNIINSTDPNRVGIPAMVVLSPEELITQ